MNRAAHAAGETVDTVPARAPQDTLRVLHFIDNLGPGGKERQLVELLKGFADAGDSESIVVSMSEGIFYRELADIPGVQVRTALRRWRKDPGPAWTVWRLAREFRPHTLVAWDFMTAVYAIPTVVLTGVRFVNALIQDAPLEIPTRIRLGARLSFPLADCILANSQAGLKAYSVAGEKAAVIRNGFDAGRLAGSTDAAATRQCYRLDRPLVVGMVATFRETKDQPTLIRAAQRILAQRRDVVFVFVGDGETRAACTRMVDGEFEPHFRFTGSVGSGLEALIACFDIGVLASFTEGISNSIMEYMALGKPVVATDCGGTRELVVEGETGYLVPAGDAEALAHRIDALLAAPAARERMGRAGRARLLAHFSLERMVEQHRALYRG